jgi:hypothetical protein
MCTDLQDRVMKFLDKLDDFQKQLPGDREDDKNHETRLIPFAIDPLIAMRDKGYKSDIIDFKTLLHLYKFYHQWITRLIIHRLGKDEVDKKCPDFMLAINFVIARYLLAFMYRARLQEGFQGFKQADCDSFLDNMRMQLIIEHIFFKLKMDENNPPELSDFRAELTKVIGIDKANNVTDTDLDMYNKKPHVSLSFDDLENILSKVYQCMPNKVLQPDLKSLGHTLLAKSETRDTDEETIALCDLLMGHMVLPSPSYDMLFRFVTCQSCKESDFDDDPDNLVITFS